MKYKYNFFEWKNINEKVDYSKYVVAPIFIEEKLNEELDTGEVVLDCVPTNVKKERFSAKTKFRLERYSNEDKLQKTWDFVVEHDDVEYYAGRPDICCHRIHLIEPSVVAQGVHVDNISLTYQLQDIDLNYRVLSEKKKEIGENLTYKPNGVPTPKYIRSLDVRNFIDTSQFFADGEFENSYRYEWDKNSLNSVRKLMENYHALNKHTITFDIPKLYVSSYNSNLQEFILFQLNTITRVKKIIRLHGEYDSEEYISLNGGANTTIRSGAKSFEIRDDDYAKCTSNSAYLRSLQEFSFDGITWGYNAKHKYIRFDQFYSTFPQIAEANNNFAETITFDTDILSQAQLDDEYTIEYQIECKVDETYRNGMILSYGYVYHCETLETIAYVSEKSYSRLKNGLGYAPQEISVTPNFQCIDQSKGVSTSFLKNGVKYNAYQLLRKALLTCDTYIIENGAVSLDEYGKDNAKQPSINYPIIFEPPKNEGERDWEARLKACTIYETVLEQKNLWEVLLQIGYYIHAIPYLEFATDGTDRFVLKFKQLGDTKTNNNSITKITVFNSSSLSEYFTSFDSYVTNLFSPQNLVEEWLTPKTSDSSYLISNNTAELHTKYPISQIEEFKIIHNGKEYNALPFIFERSIYEVLTGADPEQIFPAKGNTLYYTLGTNKIQGLNYVATSANNNKLMALKYIMMRLCGVQPSIWTQTYTFNNLRFRIKYRTQDSMRLNQFRPDIINFMKNTSYEKFPHHEQYHSQQDKIVDSERFSANLWGKLIRVGNDIYQCQEYIKNLDEEKTCGELVTIENEPYYITTIDNEWYAEALYQKVTYSKNFNQLSQIVTIPSEPRFYEVSERSKVRREVRMYDFFMISTEDNNLGFNPKFIAPNKWHSFIEDLIFKKERALPNYAHTTFLADRKRVHRSVGSNDLDWRRLFPSSEIKRTGENSVSAVDSSDRASCIVPLLHYPLHDGISFEWDMEDNFKAGDYTDKTISGANGTADEAYNAQQSVRYVDILGRADLFRFILFKYKSWSDAEIPQILKAVITPTDFAVGVQGSENNAVALDKDNREEISFNYQINLLHHKEADGYDFYTFPNIFGDKDEDLKVALLSKEQSLFDESVDLSEARVLSYNVPFKFETTEKGSIKIIFDKDNIPWINGGNMSQVRAIAFYQNNKDYGRSAFIVKNVGELTNDSDLPNFYIYPVYNEN